MQTSRLPSTPRVNVPPATRFLLPVLSAAPQDTRLAELLGKMATVLRAQLGDSCFVRTLVAKPVPQAESQGDAANEARSRSILLTGVPTLASEDDLKVGFSVFGRVERCVIHRERQNKSAVIVFEKAKSRESALSEKAERAILSLDGGVGTSPAPEARKRPRGGAYALLREYRKKRPGNAVLLSRANAWIEEKEAEEEEIRRQREAAAAGDGWTVVTTRKGARHKNQDGTGVNLQAVSKKRAESNRKEAELHQGFYHFQRREQRRSEILELQSKFKEDKKRIAELRSKRKFNPY